MIEELDWLRSGSSATRLRGGQTPVCWLKDLSQKTASIAAIRRACDWVGEIAAISPKLRDGSLFGDCLSELTRPADTPSQLELEAPRSTRRRLMKTEEAQRIYRHRASVSEWVNAVFANMGLRRFLVRGLRKVRAVALWYALAHNLLQSIRLRRASIAVD